MSKYRVQMDLAFETEREVIAFANLVEDLKHKVWNWAKEGSSQIELDSATWCRYHECFHDEDPPKPCGDYTTVDFNEVTKVVHEDGTATKVESQTLIDEKDTVFTKV